MQTNHERELRDAALAELEATSPRSPSGPAVLALVRFLAPVIQARATRVLLAHGRGRKMTNVRATVEEYTQMVFGKLFEGHGRVLQVWSEEGGLSLRNWVGRFATLRCRDVVRTAKRDPWRDQAAPPDHFERMKAADNPDHSLQARQLWTGVRTRVLDDQSDKGRTLFRLIFEEDRSTREIQDETGMSDAAIFQWRRRLRVAIREAWDVLVTEGVT